MLHDRTAEALLADLSRLPHANVTTVPFQLDGPSETAPEANREAMRAMVGGEVDDDLVPNPAPRRQLDVVSPIIEARWRDQVRVAGEVRSVRIVSQHDSPTLELVLVDDSGALSIVFLGRRQIAGVDVGTRLEASGTVGVFRNRLAMLNPSYELRA